MYVYIRRPRRLKGARARGGNRGHAASQTCFTGSESNVRHSGAALAAEAGPGVATLRAVSQFFLMGFEGDVRGSGLKPSSAAGRAVGQAPKPFPGPLAADACTAALAAEAGPGVATLRAVSQFFLMGFEGDVRGFRSQTLLGSRQGRWPGSKALPGTFGCRCLHRSLGCRSRAWHGRGHVESCLPVLSYGLRR